MSTQEPRLQLMQLLNPRFLFHALVEFLTGWRLSRYGPAFYAGVPALVAIILFGFLVGNPREATSVAQLARLETAWREAVQHEDYRSQRVCLSALIARVPHEPQYRFNLAMLYQQQGDQATARAVLNGLTEQHPDFPPARLWLADRILESSQDRESLLSAVEHYQAILVQDSDHPVANSRLGETYLKLMQPSLAEPLLLKAAPRIPTAGILLTQALLQQNKRRAASKVALQTASRLRDIVASDSSDVATRIHWAEALRLTGQHDQARSVIREGRTLSDDRRLDRALSQLSLLAMKDERSRGVLTPIRNRSLTAEALALDPTNPLAIESVCKLAMTGFFDCSAEALATAAQRLAEGIETAPEDRRGPGQAALGWIRFLQLNNKEAGNLLSKAADSDPKFQLQSARIQRLIGNELASQTIANQHLARSHKQYQTGPSLETCAAVARTLLFLNRAAEARSLVASCEADKEQLEGLRLEVELHVVDSLLTSAATTDTLINAAERLCNSMTNRVHPAALSRLSTIANSGSKASDWARTKLQSLLTSGQNTALIHSLLGTIALRHSDFEVAREHLEFANRAHPNDATTCNNLAFALLQRDPPDCERAYQLTSRALQRMPGQPEIMETRGLALIGLRRFSEAVDDLEKALGNTTDPQTVHEALAQAYLGVGDKGMAAIHRSRAAAIE